VIQIDTYDSTQHRWQVTVAPKDPDARVRFDHSTFAAAPVRRDELEKRTNDYRPRLTARGEMERELLGKFDGMTRAADLERWLLERFGNELPSPREAAAFLKATIERCG
jgi:hypothetical protein